MFRPRNFADAEIEMILNSRYLLKIPELAVSPARTEDFIGRTSYEIMDANLFYGKSVLENIGSNGEVDLRKRLRPVRLGRFNFVELVLD